MTQDELDFLLLSMPTWDIVATVPPPDVATLCGGLFDPYVLPYLQEIVSISNTESAYQARLQATATLLREVICQDPAIRAFLRDFPLTTGDEAVRFADAYMRITTIARAPQIARRDHILTLQELLTPLSDSETQRYAHGCLALRVTHDTNDAYRVKEHLLRTWIEVSKCT